ncbi:MAG: hypothetical protein JSS27_08705 [Planctomycetes bacterium]|nr:hypothetical protein [Planctomycetota bacterium]
MIVKVARGRTDTKLDKVADTLEAYADNHSGAQVELYRYNSISIRIRIIDAAFKGKSRSMRHRLVWEFLATLPEELQNDISLLVLITPEEKLSSLASVEFDYPSPSPIK